MKKYYIKVIVGNTIEEFIVIAEYYYSTTSNSTSSGNYAFYADKNLVACYPIERTIIYKIDNLEQ